MATAANFSARAFALLLTATLATSTAFANDPKLIVQITIDQLRGDLPFRYTERYGNGGWRYLMEEGTWYTNAHHPHANTETVVGHATLATGAPPSHHGMISNAWFDRSNDRLVYSVEDADYTLVGNASTRNKDAEVDPTQVSQSEGRSPKSMQSSTIADELALANARQSKIFSVSGKDRGAISMAGHAGKAFWYSTATGKFVSSTYYYPQYPKWVANWNAKKMADSYQDQHWSLSQPQKEYMFGDQDDRPYESDLANFGRTFPHSYGNRSGKYFYTLLTISPALDQLTVDFAKQMISSENLGQDNVTDYLSVSLSATDYIGHLFGPSSLESEENLLQLDQRLADLFNHINKTVGLKNTLIILSADHGTPEIPEYSASMGFDAGNIDLKSIEDQILHILKKNYRGGEKLLRKYFPPYIYLDRKVIAERGLNQIDIERQLVDGLLAIKGVATAVSSMDLAAGRITDNPVNRKVINNFHPARSGDVYIGWSQHWTIKGEVEANNHGSVWAYDSHVPVVFAGMKLSKRTITRAVSTLDIAPTISTMLNLRFPSGATGEPLEEIIKPRSKSAATLKMNDHSRN